MLSPFQIPIQGTVNLSQRREGGPAISFNSTILNSFYSNLITLQILSSYLHTCFLGNIDPLFFSVNCNSLSCTSADTRPRPFLFFFVFKKILILPLYLCFSYFLGYANASYIWNVYACMIHSPGQPVSFPAKIMYHCVSQCHNVLYSLVTN